MSGVFFNAAKILRLVWDQRLVNGPLNILSFTASDQFGVIRRGVPQLASAQANITVANLPMFGGLGIPGRANYVDRDPPVQNRFQVKAPSFSGFMVSQAP